MRRRLRRTGTAGLILWAVALPGSAPAAAQDAAAVDARGPAALEWVEELARAGRTEEARAVLTGWWEVDRPEAARDDLQRGIWLRGLLTVDPDQAALDFRRLVVEYPRGPYTARALARIAGAAEAAGERAEAARTWESLVREHRGTPEAAWAEARLAGREPDGAQPRAGRDASGVRSRQVVGASSTGARSDAATAAAGRSDTVAVPARGPDRAATAAERSGTVGGPGTSDLRVAAGSYAVQLGAFATVSRARDLMESARLAGLEPRLVRVPGSDLARVRVGRFVDEAEAEALRRHVVGLGFEALVSEDAAREEPPGIG